MKKRSSEYFIFCTEKFDLPQYGKFKTKKELLEYLVSEEHVISGKWNIKKVVSTPEPYDLELENFKHMKKGQVFYNHKGQKFIFRSFKEVDDYTIIIFVSSPNNKKKIKSFEANSNDGGIINPSDEVINILKGKD